MVPCRHCRWGFASLCLIDSNEGTLKKQISNGTDEGEDAGGGSDTPPDPNKSSKHHRAPENGAFHLHSPGPGAATNKLDGGKGCCATDAN